MRVLTIITVLIIIIVVVLLSLTWWLEYKIIFYPSNRWEWTPPEYEDIYIDVGMGERIHGMYIEVDSDAPVVLFYHGNSGNISHRSYMAHLCELYNLNLVMFDYRGYGRSTGYSNIRRLYEDADATATYCRDRFDRVFVWGESLGGGIATYAASKYKFDKLVLSSTFSSLDDIISIQDSTFMKRMSSRLLRYLIDTIPSKDRVRDITIPTAIMHSCTDELIPFECSISLYNNSSSMDKIHITIRGDHSKPELTPEDVDRLMTWLKGERTRVDTNSLLKYIEEIKNVTTRYSL